MGNKRAIYLNPKLPEALNIFLEFINKKGKAEEYWKKQEILEYLKKKKVFISKSTLDVFIRIITECQKSTNKKIVEFGNTIKILE